MKVIWQCSAIWYKHPRHLCKIWTWKWGSQCLKIPCSFSSVFRYLHSVPLKLHFEQTNNPVRLYILYAVLAGANEMWFWVQPDDFVVMVIVVMLAHHTLLYYNLYVNYVYQTRVSITYIYSGSKWCVAVAQHQVSFKDLKFTFYTSCIRWPIDLGVPF